MKIGKQIALVALMGALTATSALAYGGYGQRGMGGECGMFPQAQSFGNANMQMGQKMNKGYNKGSFHKRGNSKHGFAREQGIFNFLNLTPEQIHEVNILKTQMRLERLKSMDFNSRPMQKAFNEKGFNKDAFIKASSDRSKNKALIKANYMEKLYNILTPEQRELWVKNMQMQRR
ncbi:MAG: Spy/CpxP family protein refolding chaperone [Sulfurospirillaceae bacterium]|jgi:Spy/CpxP family protein refolding chaperone|nr:Spy/CpxP family protein refolding chaperone [Sulfurospirillaceae bacterium]MCK9545336.1 Spy/CpxP family protein refolding chaperone [Sulfurospirillaceae bacterium]MDY0238009.1 Spy/CpxP family protein refolding chaperone [Campylobacterales bacterium]NLM99865.1 hypothetical protein [Campylobacteraceae bacterium]